MQWVYWVTPANPVRYGEHQSILSFTSKQGLVKVLQNLATYCCKKSPLKIARILVLLHVFVGSALFCKLHFWWFLKFLTSQTQGPFRTSSILQQLPGTSNNEFQSSTSTARTEAHSLDPYFSIAPRPWHTKELHICKRMRMIETAEFGSHSKFFRI